MTMGLDYLLDEEKLRLFHLEKKMGGGGLVEVYKIMQRIEKVDRENFSSLSHNTGT